MSFLDFLGILFKTGIVFKEDIAFTACRINQPVPKWAVYFFVKRKHISLERIRMDPFTPDRPDEIRLQHNSILSTCQIFQQLKFLFFQH